MLNDRGGAASCDATLPVVYQNTADEKPKAPTHEVPRQPLAVFCRNEFT